MHCSLANSLARNVIVDQLSSRDRLAHRLLTRMRRRVTATRQGEETQSVPDHLVHHQPTERSLMKWTKPEAEVVAVTMEVTAYVATL